MASLASRSPRVRLLHLALALVSTLTAGAVGLGSTGCGNCAALCSSYIQATGPVTADAGTALRARLCLGDACGECDVVASGDEDEVCDGLDVWRDGDGVLRLTLGLDEPPAAGQVITATITAVESGDVLVEVTQPIEQVTDESRCGNECASATVAWE